MSKTILNLLMASLLLIFVAGCGGGGGDSVSSTNPDSTNQNLVPTDPNTDPTDQNLAPIAVAGEDQTVPVNSLATLDGTDSTDPDKNYPLTFAWEITYKPDGSKAVLSSTADSSSSFTPDLPGEYMIQLVVTDSLGMESDPVWVEVSTSNSRPVADAGDDQYLTGAVTTVYLDGSLSTDPNNDPITYEWYITDSPDSSTASLINSDTAKPTLMADVFGTYVIELTVKDDQGLVSEPDEVQVVISPEEENRPPLADAGDYLPVTVGDEVVLDGSGSTDPDNDPITYSWHITSPPKGSLTVLYDSDTVSPYFTPDTFGIYTISLVVNDGELDSEPCNVDILAINADQIDDFINELKEAVFAINRLSDSDFYNPNNRNALISKIFVVIKNYIEDGNSFSQSMFDKLIGDIAGKTDGCASVGEPDLNDWINNCDAQTDVYFHINNAINLFESMSMS